MLQLKHCIPQRLLWPCTPASAVTGTQELLLLTTLFRDLPHKGFFSLQTQSSKNEKMRKCIKYSSSLDVNQFLFLLENLFWRAKEQGWMHGAKTTISRYSANLLSTTQQHAGSLVFYQSCWTKSFKRFKKLITHFLSQFNTKEKHFPTVSFISSANLIALLSVKSQTTITSFSKKTLDHNRLKK